MSMSTYTHILIRKHIHMYCIDCAHLEHAPAQVYVHVHRWLCVSMCVRAYVRVGVRIPARTYSSVCSIILVRGEIILGTKQHREFVSRL